MALSMHTNYAALVTQNNLTRSNDLMNTAMERLSTGLRINSAADDAAGLQISNRLEAQNRGMSVAMRNAQDGISMLQTAEGAMDEMTNIAYRMNDLATQAANGTNTDTDKDAIGAEIQELGKELMNIIDNSNFGGQKLLDATGVVQNGVTLQIGSTTSETLDIAADTGLADIRAIASAASSLSFTAPTGTADAQALMDMLNTNSDTALTGTAGTANDGGVIGILGATRAKLGANINRLDHTITNLQNMSENLAASKGRITDTDYAVESANMTKQQMLMQAGTQMLAQSKQLPGMAMSLLG